MNLQNRNRNVDLLRGIAATCMILGHSFIVYPVDISNIPWCAAIKQLIYTFHMELFFILSGWVYHCRSYGAFVKKKAQRLLLPYFLFGTGSLILHAVGGSAVNGSIPVLDGIVKLLFYGGSYWFIYTLFLIFVFYPCFEHICSTVRWKTMDYCSACC